MIKPGPRTGQYRLGSDTLVADDAIAMVDELDAHRHARPRFTAAG